MSRQRATNSNRYGFNPVRLTKPLVSGETNIDGTPSYVELLEPAPQI